MKEMVNDFKEFHKHWIRESNLIENVDDDREDERCFEAFKRISELAITKKAILDLHWDIMLSLNQSIAGAFRFRNVRIVNTRSGETLFEPPEWKEVPTLMNEWIKHWSEPTTPEECKIAHILFERIHPFDDGNGRVGRIIMNIQRMKIKTDPMVYYSDDRFEYYQIFHEFDAIWKGRWTRLLKRKENYNGID